jgi:hypothetical protein
MKITARSLLLTLSFLLTLPALAIDWDWGDELASRQWRSESLDWASESHPDHPSPLVLLTTTAPPPRELWCTGATEPTEADCDTFDALLTDWTRDYLGLPAQSSVPAGVLSTFPAECASICG